MSGPGLNYQPTKSQDVVGVFDDAGAQMFEDARAVRALVSLKAKVMEHPLEDGAQISDHIVYQSTEIELTVILRPENHRDTFQAIAAAYRAAQTLVVQTKVDTYANMALVAMPYDQVTEIFDTVAIGLRLREAEFVKAQYAQLPAKKVKKKANASTLKTGNKSPKPATTQQSSAAFDLVFGSGR